MVVGNNELTATKNAGESMAISIVMVMQWYNAVRIIRWSTTGAPLEATGCHHHQSSACAIPPQQPPWLMILVGNTKH